MIGELPNRPIAMRGALSSSVSIAAALPDDDFLCPAEASTRTSAPQVFGNQQTEARSGPRVRALHERQPTNRQADILARQLGVVVLVKVVAVVLLWLLFSRAAS